MTDICDGRTDLRCQYLNMLYRLKKEIIKNQMGLLCLQRIINGFKRKNVSLELLKKVSNFCDGRTARQASNQLY